MEPLISRLVIAAPQGRSGKTTVTLGLCAALAARGLIVQPFKKGPDYIDPSWLSEAAGRPCRSLDPFFCGDDARLIAAFLAGAAGADIGVIEGNHGLFDGVSVGRRTEDARSDDFSRPARHGATEVATTNDADESFGSTAAVARTLGAPILLVVNAARMGRTAAALVHGCQTFEPGTPIAGVVLNNVARGRHEEKLRRAIEGHCGIPVLGALPRDAVLSIPDRHLGLVPRGEDAGLLPALAACRAAAERHLDLDAILEIARNESANPQIGKSANHALRTTQSAIRLALFRDRAFTFYYPENLEALEAAGAELVFVDAFRDTALPDVQALYIGGGFPEIFMDELSANAGLRASVRAAAEAGLPIYAECGGLMYLARRIVWGERSAEMAGVLPCDVEMTGRPQGHGYVEAVVDAANPFFPVGAVLRGHEFHNSRLIPHVPGAYEVPGTPGMPTAYRLNRGNGIGGGRDGLVYRNVLASYTHLHAAGAPGWAAGLMQSARVSR
jgi:cobyrinic acid a,c-diamide synthase